MGGGVLLLVAAKGVAAAGEAATETCCCSDGGLELEKNGVGTGATAAAEEEAPVRSIEFEPVEGVSAALPASGVGGVGVGERPTCGPNSVSTPGRRPDPDPEERSSMALRSRRVLSGTGTGVGVFS